MLKIHRGVHYLKSLIIQGQIQTSKGVGDKALGVFFKKRTHNYKMKYYLSKWPLWNEDKILLVINYLVHLYNIFCNHVLQYNFNHSLM
jgi:hypothetical protein